jgi:hypothetical protein
MSKSRKVGYHYTLKTPQYENCEILSPHGELMFRCCQKKARWYLDRNLGVKVKEEPLTVQLTFTPKGRGHIDDPYFLQKMENRCVVCGSTDSLTRHHIVPYCYRRFFPDDMKNHRSYDVMSLCIPCHHAYENSATELKQKLAIQYSAPVSGTGHKYDRSLARAKGAARALLDHKDTMPAERQEELIIRLRDYLQAEPTEVLLTELIDKDPHDFCNYVHHGKIVIGAVQDINAFIQQWREHFVYQMKPQYLPSNWSVDRHDFTKSKIVVK